ncbi:MAG TPA: hypothetical protein VHY35_18395 [Stellaceae bacterium]|jgi:hypothetical protein|nr:hypothetical protein [Stellaceae bacterium]
MAFKSTTFTVRSGKNLPTETRKKDLEGRHKQAMDKVIADAKNLADDRRRTLEEIKDQTLRTSAAR